MCAWALLSELHHILKLFSAVCTVKAISRLNTYYFKLLAGMAKGVQAHGLVLNSLSSIDLLDGIASKYTSEHAIIINKLI